MGQITASTKPRSPEMILRFRLHGSGYPLVQMCCIPENACCVPENAGNDKSAVSPGNRVPRKRRERKVLCPREREALEAKEQRNKRSGNRRFHCRFLSTRCQSPLGGAKRCTVSLFFVDNGVHRGCENICSDRLNSTHDVRMYLSPD